MSIFTSKKGLEIVDKNSADKIWSKKDKEIKVSPLLPIRVKSYAAIGFKQILSVDDKVMLYS